MTGPMQNTKRSRCSLSARIVWLILSIILAVGLSTFGSVYYFLTKEFNREALSRVAQTVTMIQRSVEDRLDILKDAALFFATRPDVVDAVEKGDTHGLQKLAKELMSIYGIQVVTIANSQGQVIARGHSQKTGDKVTNQINVARSLKGEASAGIEAGTVVKFALRGGAPIKVNGRIVGTVTTGIDLTSKTTFVDDMKKWYGLDCSVFKGDESVSTTIVQEGKRIADVRMDNPTVIQTVLRNGRGYMDKNIINGRTYDAAYWPIKDANGKVAGMFGIAKDRSNIQRACRNITATVLISLLAIGFLMVAAGFFIARSIAKPILFSVSTIGDGAKDVSVASNQISASSQELAEGASEQAAAIEETSASLEEISSMTKSNADVARQAEQLMSGIKEAAARSDAMMSKLTVSMEEICSASEETSKIIKTIDEIAFQTNLLALNAAVEAARAGEAGAGFAVVADEVRNLAMRAADAAKNTSHLIQGTINKVKGGSELVGQTGKEFSVASANVNRIGKLINEITAASFEQSQGIEQINLAVNEMDKAVQRNAASAEECASAAAEMKARANQTKDCVEVMKLLVYGSKMRDRIEVTG